ncbi:conserved exported hypothetical protein [uncultured Paludibacter sp.]|uniref:Uncharacterized protein n=1 Tax=uncultured Paludibacter sp. TaxID=497635 RepID=A0A653ADC1_9BACT|nr:conserved exported hypothetical protein [uncultured Paludibacter sp.]
MKTKFTFLLALVSLCNALSAQNSDKITKVLEYKPAPGQHINRIYPTPDMSTTPENALIFAENRLKGNAGAVGLGAFGGYVIVGFDHSIVNVKGEYDFKALGNAFANGAEPGIVMVCQDLNKNGKPDAEEPWYELAGSEYFKSETIKNYEITYYRPNPDGQKSNIKWTDNHGGEGTVTHISFASQSTMYPLWISENTLVFKGTKLKNTVYNDGVFKLPSFDWGYVDNNPNTDPIEKNGFKIDWAVDADGNAVNLDYIDFIKVYTAQTQEAGILGETSTDFAGIIDLHPDATATSVKNINKKEVELYISNGNLQVKNLDLIKEITILNLNGSILIQGINTQSVNIERIQNGIYIVKIKDGNNEVYTQKIIKK